MMFGGLFLMTPISAAAETASVNGTQIEIRATVKPMRYVIVNAAGEVLQISSNNNQPDIEPAIYLNEVKLGNELPVTPQVIETTRVLLKGKAIKPGILYNRAALVVLSDQSMSVPLQVVNSHQLASLRVVNGAALLIN